MWSIYMYIILTKAILTLQSIVRRSMGTSDRPVGITTGKTGQGSEGWHILKICLDDCNVKEFVAMKQPNERGEARDVMLTNGTLPDCIAAVVD